MTQISHPTSALENYTQDYSDLFKDKRLFTGFQATITGILGSGTTRIAQIAKSAPQTGTSPHSEQRLRRLIHNKNQRANLTPEIISSKLTSKGAKQLAKHDEVKVILDGSDLRKPHSTSLEYLDTVLDLNGDPVAGYPTLNAIGIGQNGKQAFLDPKTHLTGGIAFVPQDLQFARG